MSEQALSMSVPIQAVTGPPRRAEGGQPGQPARLSAHQMPPAPASGAIPAGSRDGGLLGGMRDGAWLSEQEFPPLAYHVDGIIPEGVTALARLPKVGKRMARARLPGLRVASGGARARRNPWRTSSTCCTSRSKTATGGCKPAAGSYCANDWRPDDPIPGEFTYMTRIVPGQVIATIGEYLETYGMLRPLIIVDTLGRVLPPAFQGETPYSRDYRVMSQLKDLADGHPGAALLLCHHDRKAVTDDFVDSVSGTNGIAGGADTVLVLTRGRGESGGLLQVTGRDVSEGAYAVDFDWGVWTLDGADLGQAAEAASTRRAASGLDERSAGIVAHVSRPGRTGTPRRRGEGARPRRRHDRPVPAAAGRFRAAAEGRPRPLCPCPKCPGVRNGRRQLRTAGHFGRSWPEIWDQDPVQLRSPVWESRDW